jgi:C4-dicarboxylate-specific signal transduction histidine kinase
MSELVEELAPALQAMARAAHVSLKVDAQTSLPEVNVDRLRIQLVLFSLVQNAIEASTQTDAAQVLIEVRADRYAVETSIIDTGTGVPADLTDKLFRPFFTTKSGGTGLGLASSRASIEVHEGSIGFDKAKSTGSRFWFRLPVVTC